MKKLLVCATLCLIITPFAAHAADNGSYAAPTVNNQSDNPPAVMERTSPDNTDINQRDRDQQTLTPLDQSNSTADIDITQALRKSIMKQNLSIDAQNIKIITRSRIVTLRGVVSNNAEKDEIVDLAKNIPAIKSLNDELEVK